MSLYSIKVDFLGISHVELHVYKETHIGTEKYVESSLLATMEPVTINLDPPFLFPPIHIFGPPAFIFLKYMDSIHVINYSRGQGLGSGYKWLAGLVSRVCMAGLVFRVCMGVRIFRGSKYHVTSPGGRSKWYTVPLVHVKFLTINNMHGFGLWIMGFERSSYYHVEASCTKLCRYQELE